MTVTIPGNLLLLGEYAVLEEGGLGVTLALERRIIVSTEEAPRLEVEGSWGREAVRWSDRHPEASPLFSAVVQACRRYLGLGSPSADAPHPDAAARPESGLGPTARIRIDSSAFFLSPERKSGFGSSAAVAVGLACSLLVLGGLDPRAALGVVAPLALEAHRTAQGGGSGYDVYTSTHGGTGLFTGGANPAWRARPLGWLPPLYLLQGPRSVSTAHAVQRYREWKRTHPAEAQAFLVRSNEAARGFVSAGSWKEAEGFFRRGREQGLRLGEEIGVPATLEVPSAAAGGPCKAVGAGNELGVLAMPGAPDGAELPGGLEPLVPAWEGVRWQL